MKNTRCLPAARAGRLLAALALLGVAVTPTTAEVRESTFRSPSLGTEVRYIVDLPPSYEESERRYRSLFAVSNDGILVSAHASGDIRRFDPTLAHRCGTPRRVVHRDLLTFSAAVCEHRRLPSPRRS